MNYTTLNTGDKMPMLGLGVYRVGEEEQGVSAMLSAFKAGYRSIDTAEAYDNEHIVGQAVRESGLKREELFITTKLSNPSQRSGDPEAAFAQSLQRLGMDYVDLYLIHWPVKEHFVQSWLAMEKIYKSGRAKAIGVSNFQSHHIDAIKEVWTVVPAINQIELHPRFTQKPMLEDNKTHGIITQAWSPLGGNRDADFKGNMLNDKVLVELGQKYNKTTAQIILRWNIELGIVTIPKSVTPHRICENIGVFDFALTAAEVAAIDALNQDHRVGPDPDNFDF